MHHKSCQAQVLADFIDQKNRKTFELEEAVSRTGVFGTGASQTVNGLERRTVRTKTSRLYVLMTTLLGLCPTRG